jgi:hypothetical protein
MKRIVLALVAIACFVPGLAVGLTITFDNSAPPGGAPSHGSNPTVFDGFTFTATGGATQYSLDPGYDPTNAPPNNTDFETFENSPVTWTMSGATPFTLGSLRAAAIYGDGAGTLTVTGNLSGGGTVVQVFNLPAYSGSAQWATYVLNPGFANLASVDFAWSGEFIGIDDVVVSGQSAAAPVPSLSMLATVSLALMLVATAFLARRRRTLRR